MPKILATNGSRHLNDPEKISKVISLLQSKGYDVELAPRKEVNPLTESSDPVGRVAELTRRDVDIFWPARGGKAAIELFDHDLNIPFRSGQIYIGMSDHTILMHYWTFNSDITLLYGPVLGDLARTMETNSMASALAALEKATTQAPSFALDASPIYDDWINQKSAIKTGGAWLIQDFSFNGPYLAGLFSRMYTAQMMGIYGSLSGYLLFIEQLNIDPEEFYRTLREFCKMQPDIAGIVCGRFPLDCGIDEQKLRKITASIPELKGKVVRGNYDFGHSYPITTFPVRGKAMLDSGKSTINLTF